MDLYIGCSGFHYNDWVGKFYPEKLPKKAWLEYYARHFNTVEINNTFYRMPEEKTILDWKSKTPASFKFTIKANRFFTHRKNLVTDSDFRERFYEFTDTAGKLGDKLGCILWQLPGNLSRNTGKLEKFCQLLDRSITHVIEFRHISWFEKEIHDLLSAYGVSWCMLSAPDPLPEDVVVTSATAYMRFHGKSSWYRYHYHTGELDEWSHKLREVKGTGAMYIYFNNDYQAWAIDNATYLRSILPE